MTDFSMTNCKTKMDLLLIAVKKNFSGLRTGRASPSLLDNIKISAYDNQTPLTQLASISVPEAKLLTIQVWDKGLVKAVEKAIFDSDLGLTPSTEGQLIRLAMPELTVERRKEIAKLAAKYAEHGKICIRNIRREFIDQIKNLIKNSKISEDEQHKFNKDIQDITDQFIKNIDEAFNKKEAEIMHM